MSKPDSIVDTSFVRLLDSTKLDIRTLRSLSWHGVPAQHRALCWKLLLGYLPPEKCWRDGFMNQKRQEYNTLVKKYFDMDQKLHSKPRDFFSTSDLYQQVHLDVIRTAPDLNLFNEERVQFSLERLLCIWGALNPCMSYVQGMNDLVVPLYSVFLGDYFGCADLLVYENDFSLITEQMIKEVEADTFWCLSIFLESIKDHYTTDLPGLARMVNRLESCMQKVDTSLCNHLKSKGLEFNWFAFKWMNCMLIREFSLPCIIRMWDTYLSEEDLAFEDLHIGVCAGLLQEFSPSLKSITEYDDLFVYIQVS